MTSTKEVSQHQPILVGTWLQRIEQLREFHLPIIQKRSEEPVEPDHYVVCDNITLQEYLDYDRTDLKELLWFHNGEVLIYELSRISPIHEVINTWTFSRFVLQLPEESYDGTGSMTQVLGQSGAQADSSITPSGRPRPVPEGGLSANGTFPFPTVIIEVGVSQTVASLHQKAKRYLSNTTDIQVVVCIKIFPPKSDDGTFKALALLYRRSVSTQTPVQVISFGTIPFDLPMVYIIQGLGPTTGNTLAVNTPPTVPNDPLYLLRIPLADIYNGDANGVPGNPVDVIIDLFHLMTKIATNWV
ncbi:hypothetical protein SAMD00019534_001830 [Acytostelium subglobosum LB1]|uniref:hypothetical protein n=1 Tax=Acytostelium subglobosum LB1 TaxID=1410327 RepID=UPI000644B39B|nr:hypothetical protein SAMD00019534_001830 [Acytostelium subglobosum LB1]GAM17008.1 hypothetical protein SAMD00019534_001830 [Acytostelium subglobosum LB1]|eukprot:XP_012759070.1 hypothetical protein SAMD00019534_001830 [Acytostelium subglobosum LB1]